MNFRQICLLLLVALATRTTNAQGTGHIQPITTLGNGADVIFVLDGSNRVSQQEWTYLQNWLNSMIQYWNIGSNNIQVGFYTYGDGAHAQWQLRQAGNANQAQTEINSLQWSGGASTAGQAIRLAYREGFSAANGGRANVPHIVVHVSNGPAADPTFLEQEVQAAKQQGIYVYNIGVGAGGNLQPGTESKIASEPTYRYVMRADNYQTLGALTSSLANNVANELPSGPAGSLPDTSHACMNQADVVFLLDGSGSVGTANFQTLTNYVKTFSSQLPVGPNGVHIGVMQFSDMPRAEFGLPVYTDRASLLKGIDNIQYMGGGTNTDTALQAMRTQMFSQQMGARAGVPRIAIVITDGRSANMANTIKEADLARQAGIGIVAIGVGDGIRHAELQGIADSSRDLFNVQDYNDLPGVTQRVMNAACAVRATAAPVSATVDPHINDPCKDNLPNCNQYNANMCTEYAGWAKDNCARHCHLCNPIMPSVLPSCADKMADCGDYDIGVCQDEQYRPWATENCALYCGLCGAGTTTNGYYGQCFYKGASYSTGETWNDGCDYTCTCVNGQTGQYSCNNRCPLYSELPAECTLVRAPGKCCLEPVCNFNPTISTRVTSGLARTADGMSVCEYQGNQYVQGQSWDVGCQLKCVCADASTGQIKCQDFCPHYGVLPQNCHLQQTPGECCAKPVCEFSTQTGTISGSGRTSGVGAVARPTAPAPCVDVLPNCAQYTQTACKDPYIEWASDNCRAFCGLCSDGRVIPKDTDHCTYQGHQYRQGETWSIGCDQECICEQAVYGYYRCYSICPVYNNVPSQCTRTPASGTQCCETITCPSNTHIVPSTTNVLSIGSGNYIMQPNPLQPNQMVPVVPTITTGGTINTGTGTGTGTGTTGYQAPTIQGCLYKGQLYVQGQRWDDGCDQVCECTSASQGMYSCAARCPTYQNLPMGCSLQTDPADACCRVPVCQAGVNYIPLPVYTQGTISSGLVQPPDPSQLMATSQTGVVTQRFPQSANSPPTMPPGPVPTGGIGYCVYKNQTYRQSETWTDGCSYNCLCEDSSRGFWRCSDMCLTYPPMPQYCKMITDLEFPCCQKPFCEIPYIINSTFGLGSTTPRPHISITTNAPSVITTTTPPRPATCVYKGQEYGQGQEWYDGCDYRCTCYDALSNLYSCTARCPTFFGLDQTRCTNQPDPRDPTCCTIPVCEPPTTHESGTTPIPTVPGGSFEVTNSPGIGYCDYKGTHYTQGQRWDDGCQYSCECLDEYSGRYRCDEKCPRFPALPSGCIMVTDFANPCCQKPTCNFQGTGGTISGQTNLQTPAPNQTPVPGGRKPVCVYNNVEYQQGQTWDDGCNKRCRCEDAERGLYVCDDRCAKYAAIPSECVMVTDPTDQCCKVPQCHFNPTSGQTSGQGAQPTPFPTAAPGVIVGQPNLPTPLPGQTPTPLGFCVYKGREYRQGQEWQDGCEYTCVCEDQTTGRYRCDERCPKYPNLPTQCRLFKDPADPCCSKPDCSFTPNSGQITGLGSPTPAPQTTPAPHFSPVPGQTTVAPLPGHTTLPTLSPPFGTTQAPNPYNPPSPSPTPVCVYRNQVYAQGQTWYDGCDYVCVCEDGMTGVYRCNDRCPSYPAPQGVKCTMKPDPKDPMCCQIPECETPAPTPISPGGPYVVPTIAPQGVVTGGSVNPTTTPPPTPLPGQTIAPNPNSTPAPQPRSVCVYKGQEYTQGQKWQDGCDYNCECVNSMEGLYQCTEMCPRYAAVPQGCYMVRDVYNPCCQTPVCPFPPTGTPQPATTVQPPTAPNGQTLSPPLSTPAPRRTCVYNGVPYRQGQTWDDGCDLRCRCEDEMNNVYRCDQRCARFELTAGCVMVTDPRDSCCLVPNCPLVVPTTPAPVPVITPAPLPGQTPSPNPTQAPNPFPTANPLPVPTAIPGVIVGNSVNQPPNETFCVYDSKHYRQSETWIDGCRMTCVCVDQTTGRYECKQRCPVYTSIPSYCTMVTDPQDSCCEKPFCTAPSTPAPQPGSTVAPNPQHTVAPPTGPTPVPGQTTHAPVPGNTPAPTPSPVTVPPPQPRNVCVMNNRQYVEGQQWYDNCDQICVCEDGQTGFYRCRDRCAKYPSLPSGCTLVVDPQDPVCCKVPQCAPTPGPSGYVTPPPGQSPTPFTVTNVPGIVTGRAPSPTPGPDGSTPAPRSFCVYKGQQYARGQRWQDGCDYNCVCENEMTGEYKCEERCNSYPMIPPQCYLQQDPADYCCKIMHCDMSRSTPNPFLTPAPLPGNTQAPNLSPSTPAPTPGPFDSTTPRPVPTYIIQPNPNPVTTPSPNPTQPPTYAPQPFCVYNGVAYRQGDTWRDGCSKTCRCDNADMNYYTCQDRCPVYTNINPTCIMTLDSRDSCCQVPVCPDLPTPAPTPLGQTPIPGPTQAPTATPYPLPQKVPTGTITGSNPNPNPNPSTGPNQQPRSNMCLYMGVSYRQGQKWDDGCQYQCECIDEMTGRYVCNQRCNEYRSVPSFCMLVKDPADACCMKPLCTPPPTVAPGMATTVTPPVGVTYAPNPMTYPPGMTPEPGHTYAPGATAPPGVTFTPGPGLTYPPQPRTYAPWQTPAPGVTYAPGVTPPLGATYIPTPGPPVGVTYAPNPMTYPPYMTPQPGHTYAPGATAPPGVTFTPGPGLTYPPQPRTYAPWQTPALGVTYAPGVTPPLGATYIPTPGPSSTLAPPVGVTYAPNPMTYPPYMTPQPGQTYAPGATAPPGVTFTPAPGQTYPPQPRTYAPWQTPAPGVTYPPGATPPLGATYIPTPAPPVGVTYAPNPMTYPPYMTPQPGQTYPPGATPPPGVTFTPAPGQTYAPQPRTYAPWQTPAPGSTYPPGATPPLGATYIPTPAPTNPPVPTYIAPLTTPQPVCIMSGRAYTQGQQWYDGCRQICVCDDGMTGHYTCRQRCATYPNSDPRCISVPDPKDPTCCTIPQCPNPTNPDLPTGQKGTITGSGTPAPPTTLAPNPYNTPPVGVTYAPNPMTYPPNATPAPGMTYAPGATPPLGVTFTPAPGQTYAPQPRTFAPWQTPAPGSTYAPGATPPIGATYIPTPVPTQAPQPREVCVYKGTEYRQGVRWRDGCDYECVCEDGMTGSYKCTDRCAKYPPITAPGCTMQRDPSDACCEIPVCTPIMNLTPPPGQTLAPGQTPAPQPGSVPQPNFCVYQGVPYRQGQTWNDGCDKKCRCEDGMTGTINCDDRCPTYQATQPGCVMVTDPQDQCCQIPRCENPNPLEPTKVITGVPGTISGNSLPPQNPNPLAPRSAVCVYRGVQYQPNQRWDDGCSYSCICDDGMNGHYTCTERCARTPNIPTQCQMVQDPADLCCQVASCPIPTPNTTPAPNPNVNPTPVPHTVAPLPGQTPAPNPFNTPAPTPPPSIVPMCLYKNQYYREKQIWYDGCNAVCTCEDGSTNFYRCQERCGDYKNVDTSCIMVPDPKDPQCCKMPECPLIPQGGTTPATPGIIRPPQPTAVITNYPTPQPQPQSTLAPQIGPNGVPIPQTTQTPTPRTGCMYNGRTYHAGEQWDDGCQYKCACLDDMTGQYRCTEKCARVPSVPNNCVLIADPQDQCCQVPYCDFVNPTPFPNGIPTPSPNQTPLPGQTTPIYYVPGYVTSGGNGQPTTAPPLSPVPIAGQSQVCVYMGVIYRAGQTWEDGCTKKCVCDDALHGMYSCTDRCPSYGNPGPECVMRTNPADPCCLVPECNPNYVTPGTGGVISGSNPTIHPATQPGFTGAGTQQPYIIAPTAAPATFTGQRPPIDYNQPGMTGYSNMCVYKSTPYTQGQKWDDGCQFKCECVDALRGTYRCTERCSNVYFMPDGCTMEPDPNDACCQRAKCLPSAFPTPTPLTIINPPTMSPTQQPPITQTAPHVVTTPLHLTASPGPVFQGTRSPIGSTVQSFTGKPRDMCVYTDGRTFSQSQTWTDGCGYNCRCDDAAQNVYHCDFRCQVYSDLPPFCHLENDPADQCCQKVACTPTAQGTPIIAITGDKQPTASPTMEPSIQNVVPIGTHTVISGSGLPPGEQTPGFFGGRQLCVYKGTVYQAGESWEDGCDYTCQCLAQEPAVYSCVSKCPDFPPLPHYCYMVNVPGQCCPSMKCDVPNVGTYNPTPQITPGLMPTPAPGTAPQRNPQIILSPGTTSVTGGVNPPGGGTIIGNPSTISGITDRCVYQGVDGHYRAYAQGETWNVNTCDYKCECVDAHSGFYQCIPMCPDYGRGNLPADCTLQYVNGECCPALSCRNPDGTMVNPQTNPQGTNLPVYGVMGTGYQGFKPGVIPGKPGGTTGYTNKCIYKGVPHDQGEKWDDGCDYSCTCTDSRSGMYTCTNKCQTYTALPPLCSTSKDASGCCDVVRCQAPVTTAPPTTAPPVTQPGQTGNCVDRTEANCHMYDKATSCTGIYEPWARDNCPQYCGLCPSAVTTTPGPCADKLNNCNMYGQTACTGQYEAWARTNCPKYCNLCPCVDRIANCNQYGSFACMGQYEAWARDNCMKTCGYCPGMQPFSTQVLPTGSGVVPDGWTLLLKGVSGVPGDLWQLWQSPNTANANIQAAQRLTSEYKGHYKPALANSLDQCDFDKMKVAIYNNGVEKASIVFDGRNTGRDDWFTQARILDSSYTDLRQQLVQYFQLQGDPSSGREFYVGGTSSGCTGTGWFFVSTRSTCSYESASKPAFYYSSGSTSSSWQSGQVQSGDVFAIMGQGGTCSAGATMLPTVTHKTDVCVYKNQIYQQSESWQDGCDYNCTCVDATRGLYQCNNLCLTYTNLPDTCSLIKAPGECCAKPTGPGCGSSNACLYNGNIYQQGQEWIDGCDYKCTCKDGTTGRYECTTRCLQFQLPEICHMDPAPAGKCCEVPNCPSFVHITYPAGYVPV